MQLQNIFIHHVFFWLNENNELNRNKLIEGLEKLSTVKTIIHFHIGIPAGTNRDVIDNTYSISWALFFNTPEDQESYQTDPIHLNFVKEYSHLWKKVKVFDTINT